MQLDGHGGMDLLYSPPVARTKGIVDAITVLLADLSILFWLLLPAAFSLYPDARNTTEKKQHSACRRALGADLKIVVCVGVTGLCFRRLPRCVATLPRRGAPLGMSYNVIGAD